MLRNLSLFSLLPTLAAGSLFADNQDIQIQTNYGDLAAAYPNEAQSNKSMQSQQQETCCEIVPALPCPNYWRISGDYLYLLPTVDDTHFVQDSPVETEITTFPEFDAYPNGKRKSNDFSFHSGFRVGAEFAMCNGQRELEAYYTRLSTEHSRTVEGNFLWAIMGPGPLTNSFENYMGSASSKLALLYQRLDVDFSQQIVDAHGMHFYIKAGLEGAYLRLKEQYNYHESNAINDGVFTQKSRITGIGPQIGLGLDYNFYETASCASCRHVFSITGLFSGSLLVSQSKAKAFADRTFFSTDTGFATQTLENITNENTWRTITALHARVGLNYTVRNESAGFTVEAGYEFNSYIRGLTRIIFPDTNISGGSFSNYYNFDVQGFYASAGLSF